MVEFINCKNITKREKDIIIFNIFSLPILSGNCVKNKHPNNAPANTKVGIKSI